MFVTTNKLWIISFWLIILTMKPHTATAQEAVIDWYKLDFPPYTIKAGTHRGQGLGDRIQAFVSSKLPHYQHRSHFVTTSRLYQDLDEQVSLCTVNSNYDVQASLGRNISLPTNIYYNYNLISRLSSADNHMSGNQSGVVSLKQLLDTNAKRLILPTERPYQHLDHWLEPAKRLGNVQISEGVSLSDNALSAIDRRQADYTLELCSTVRYLSATRSFQHQFVCSDIKENPTPFGRAAITCTTNPWGEKVIAEINEILYRYRGRKEYMDLMQRWYVPNDRQQQRRYWQHYRTDLLSVTPQSTK